MMYVMGITNSHECFQLSGHVVDFIPPPLTKMKRGHMATLANEMPAEAVQVTFMRSLLEQFWWGTFFSPSKVIREEHIEWGFPGGFWEAMINIAPPLFHLPTSCDEYVMQMEKQCLVTVRL